MKFTSIALTLLLPLVSSSALLKRQVDDAGPCQEPGGPTPDAKAALIDYVLSTAFGGGEICPGRDGHNTYCAKCKGAIIIVRNESDENDNCMTPGMFTDAMSSFGEGRNICTTNFGTNIMLQLLYESVESSGAECNNPCFDDM